MQRKQGIYLLLAALLVLVLCTGATAVTWTKIGTSGLSTTPRLMQSYEKPIVNSIAMDAAGNIYTTANNGDNRGLPGGVTIYKTDGSKVDVDVNGLGIPGGITSLVTAGDGKVYGLQNWREAWQWIYPSYQGITTQRFCTEGPENIIRINVDGTVDVIYTALPTGDGWSTSLGASSGTITSIDLGDGNKGLEFAHTAVNKDCCIYRKTRDTKCTLAGRFKVTAFTPGTGATQLANLSAGDTGQGATNTGGVMNGIDNDLTPLLMLVIKPDSHFWLTDLMSQDSILDLGPLVLGDWNEIYMYLDGSTKQFKVTWNGTVYNVDSSAANRQLGCTTSYTYMGAACSWANDGLCTVVYDWMAYGHSEIGSSTSKNWVSFLDGTDVPSAGFVFNNVSVRQSLSGLATGPDGYLYFGTAGLWSDWQNWLHRINVMAGPPYTVETHVPATGGSYSDGFLFNGLTYCSDGFFGTLNGRNDVRFLDALIWDGERSQMNAPVSGSSSPGWDRDYPTAYAYDSDRNIFWRGGWSCQAPAGTPDFNWMKANTYTSRIVDLGSGNKGLQMDKLPGTFTAGSPPVTSYKSDGFGIYARNRGDNSTFYPTSTLAARFRVDAFSGAQGVWFLMNSPNADPTTPGLLCTRACLGVDVIGGVDHWVFSLVQPNGAGTTMLADLGPFATGVFNEVYIYAESTATGVPRRTVCWWNGVKAFDGYISDAQSSSWIAYSLWEFGSACLWPSPTVPGTNTVTFDWAGGGKGEIKPTDANPGWIYYVNGSYAPIGAAQGDVFGTFHSSILTQYTGDWPKKQSLWNDMFTPTSYASQINNMRHFHANGVNPGIGRRQPGWYWLGAMAVNPNDGKAWMSWASDERYDYGDVGHVITRDVGGALGDEGVPEAGAQVVSLKIAGGKAYAVTCNMTTGVYSLYKADTPAAGGGPQSIGSMKSRTPGVFVSTDAAKTVTYPDPGWGLGYFYIEDNDRSGGIRVMTTDVSVATKGDKVNVSGMMDVVNGEAVLSHATVTPESTGNPDLAPLEVIGKAAGGGKSGAQPATVSGIGLSTVGLLVKLAGVAMVVNDDVGGVQWIAVDDGSGATVTYTGGAGAVTMKGIKVVYEDWPWSVTDGDKVSVVGVVSVENGKPIIRARSASDLTVY